MDTLDLPIRHGEGKFYAEDQTMNRLKQNRQIVLQYADPHGHPAQGRFPHNPNGSLMDIAGVCDVTGRIFGLMPHPEAFNHWTNHPDWTREAEDRRRKDESAIPDVPTPGIQMFQNAVTYLNAG
jgi:phosphoribosylformylglycinamidine synthase